MEIVFKANSKIRNTHITRLVVLLMQLLILPNFKYNFEKSNYVVIKYKTKWNSAIMQAETPLTSILTCVWTLKSLKISMPTTKNDGRIAILWQWTSVHCISHYIWTYTMSHKSEPPTISSNCVNQIFVNFWNSFITEEHRWTEAALAAHLHEWYCWPLMWANVDT